MAGLYDDGTLVNKMDDVARTIELAMADELPFTGMLAAPKKAVQRKFGWSGMVNSNPAVEANPDGFNQVDFTSEQPENMYGYCQEFRDAWKVGRQAEATETYTEHNDPVFQKKLALARLFRKKERAYCSRQEHRDQINANADGGSRVRGAILALTPKLGTDPQTLLAYPDNLRTVSGAYFTGALDTLDETALENLITAIYTAKGAQVDLMGLMGISVQQRLGRFIAKDLQASGPFAVSTRKRGEAFDFNLTVEVFKFHAGTLRTVATSQLAFDLATGLPTAYSPLSGILFEEGAFLDRTLFPLEHNELPKLGGGKSGYYAMMTGLQPRMPRRCGLIYTGTAVTPASTGG